MVAGRGFVGKPCFRARSQRKLSAEAAQPRRRNDDRIRIDRLEIDNLSFNGVVVSWLERRPVTPEAAGRAPSTPPTFALDRTGEKLSRRLVRGAQSAKWKPRSGKGTENPHLSSRINPCTGIPSRAIAAARGRGGRDASKVMSVIARRNASPPGDKSAERGGVTSPAITGPTERRADVVVAVHGGQPRLAVIVVTTSN